MGVGSDDSREGQHGGTQSEGTPPIAVMALIRSLGAQGAEGRIARSTLRKYLEELAVRVSSELATAGRARHADALRPAVFEVLVRLDGGSARIAEFLSRCEMRDARGQQLHEDLVARKYFRFALARRLIERSSSDASEPWPPWAILDGLCTDQVKDDAGAQLHKLLTRISASVLIEPKSMTAYVVEPDQRESLVGAVEAKVLEKISTIRLTIGLSDAVDTGADLNAVIVRYLETMVVRRHITARRGAARERVCDEDTIARLADGYNFASSATVSAWAETARSIAEVLGTADRVFLRFLRRQCGVGPPMSLVASCEPNSCGADYTRRRRCAQRIATWRELSHIHQGLTDTFDIVRSILDGPPDALAEEVVAHRAHLPTLRTIACESSSIPVALSALARHADAYKLVLPFAKSASSDPVQGCKEMLARNTPAIDAMRDAVQAALEESRTPGGISNRTLLRALAWLPGPFTTVVNKVRARHKRLRDSLWNEVSDMVYSGEIGDDGADAVCDLLLEMCRTERDVDFALLDHVFEMLLGSLSEPIPGRTPTGHANSERELRRAWGEVKSLAKGNVTVSDLLQGLDDSDRQALLRRHRHLRDDLWDISDQLVRSGLLPWNRAVSVQVSLVRLAGSTGSRRAVSPVGGEGNNRSDPGGRPRCDPEHLPGGHRRLSIASCSPALRRLCTVMNPGPNASVGLSAHLRPDHGSYGREV